MGNEPSGEQAPTHLFEPNRFTGLCAPTNQKRICAIFIRNVFSPIALHPNMADYKRLCIKYLDPHVLSRITYTHYSQVSFAQMHIIIPFLGCQMLAFYYIPRGRDHSFLKSILILLSYRYIYICPCCYLEKPFHYQFYLY